jgi:hypothetical protein
MFKLRSSVLALVPVLVGLTTLAVFEPLPAQASVGSPTSVSVLGKARTAMTNAGGVHVTVLSKAGSTYSTVVVDIGKDRGVETITSGLKKVVITVTPTYAYLSGSATGLTTIMGLTVVQQKKLGSKSMSMKSGTAPYANLKANLTTTALTHLLPVAKGTTLSTDKATKNFLLTWTTPASATNPKTTSVMTISSKGTTLPIKEIISAAGGGGTTTFSNWGENVKVPVPSASSVVTYKQVFG